MQKVVTHASARVRFAQCSGALHAHWPKLRPFDRTTEVAPHVNVKATFVHWHNATVPSVKQRFLQRMQMVVTHAGVRVRFAKRSGAVHAHWLKFPPLDGTPEVATHVNVKATFVHWRKNAIVPSVKRRLLQRMQKVVTHAPVWVSLAQSPRANAHWPKSPRLEQTTGVVPHVNVAATFVQN